MSKTFDRHTRNHVSNHQHSLQLLRSTRVFIRLWKGNSRSPAARCSKNEIEQSCCIAWKHNLSRIGENYTMRLAIAIFKPYGGESPSVSTNPTTGASSLWWASKKWRRRRCAAGPPSPQPHYICCCAFTTGCDDGGRDMMGTELKHVRFSLSLCVLWLGWDCCSVVAGGKPKNATDQCFVLFWTVLYTNFLRFTRPCGCGCATGRSRKAKMESPLEG